MAARGADTTVRAPRRARPVRATTATLRVAFTLGALSEEVRALGPGTITVGRGDDCDLILDDPRASRLHAKLSVLPDGSLKITDESTNGTYVDGRRARVATLGDGDVIRIGDSLLVVRFVSREPHESPPLHGLFGGAPAMLELRRAVAAVAAAEGTVLVLGETGSGKELVARAIHGLSGRRGPLVTVNCGAIPEALAESQLFGHVAGAFTGASSQHTGFFRAADGGVLFLDEIGELIAPLQPKLLRALEERAVTPVGAAHPVCCDVRIVAATNRDLRADAAQGRFRGDLYARLAELVVTVPPLRQRLEDVLPLLRRALGDDAPPISADLAEAMLCYRWPYNVRELIKLATDLRVRAGGAPLLELDLIADRLQTKSNDDRHDPPEALNPARPIPDRATLVALLRKHNGVIADVAEETGRSRKQVYRWITSHALDVAAFRQPHGG